MKGNGNIKDNDIGDNRNIAENDENILLTMIKIEIQRKHNE